MNKLFLAAALLLSVGELAQAQTPSSGGPTPSAPAPDPTEVPLDGGASLLLASGVAYGLRRLRRARYRGHRPAAGPPPEAAVAQRQWGLFAGQRRYF